jgi:hypothetical protein
MTRTQYNAEHGTNLQPGDQVFSATVGGPAAQYDPHCSRCWLGHVHTWEQHDASLARSEATKKSKSAWPSGYTCGTCRDRNEPAGMTCRGPECRHHPDYKGPDFTEEELLRRGGYTAEDLCHL